MALNVGTASETVEVTAAPVLMQTESAQITTSYSVTRGDVFSRNAGGVLGTVDKKKQQDQAQQASANVFNLQKKVAGVLPVRVDVPRAGASYRFARALVLDEETKLTFNYRTK